MLDNQTMEKNKMKKITRSVIKLSEIPEELHQYIVAGHSIHTYLEVHISDDAPNSLSLWLLDKYPTLKSNISFLIHIDR
jgi:hypothetical protein